LFGRSILENEMKLIKSILSSLWVVAVCVTPTFGSSAAQKPKATVTKGPAPTPITADALADDYSPDFTQGDAKWRSKTVEVTGFCIAPDPDNLAIWLVEPRYGILCQFPKAMKSKIQGLQNGQCVKIVGKVGYFSTGRIEIACTSLALCDSTPVAITTDALFDEFKDNPKAALEKYKKRAIFVHGNLGSVVTQTGGVQRVILGLKTKAGEGVWCFLPNSTDDRLSQLAEDRGVSVFGKVESYSKLNGQFRIKITTYSYKGDPE